MIFTSLAAKAFLSRYGRLLAAAAVVGLLLTLYSCQIDRADHRGYKRARDEMAVQISKANDSARAAEQAAQQRTNEVSRQYEKSIEDLDGKYRAAADQLRNVRLCPPAARAVQVPGATRTPGGAAAETGGERLPEPTPQDSRVQELILLARDADACAARLAALQQWAVDVR